MEDEKEIITVSEERYLSVAQVKDHISLVNNILKEVLVEGKVENGKITKDGHYSKLPGCGEKLVLLKPGAEKLCLAFNLVPKYKINILPAMENKHTPPGHRDYEVTCELFNRTNGNFVGQGMGSCTTMESKYRKRGSLKICPQCGNNTIVKGKTEYGGGWLCFDKKGGCGAKFNDGDMSIESQISEKTDNPDIADVYNTVKKMACKRALVHAVIQCLAVGDIFMQDVEDMKPSDLNQNQGKPKPPMTPPKAKSETDPNKVTKPQMKKIQAMFKEVNPDADSDAKRKTASTLTGKELKSMSDLTKEDAKKLIDGLEELKKMNAERDNEEKPPF